MLLGLLGAAAAAVCYGVGSVLQAVAASRAEATTGADPRLVLRLLSSWPYVVGLVLDGLGFVASIAALQTLPLFVVQAVVAASLAVTALVAALALGLALSRTDRVAVPVVVAGLALLGASARAESPAGVSPAAHWSVLGASVAVGALAVGAGRASGRGSASLLGVVAGLAFGVVAVAARVLPLGPGDGLVATVRAVLADPAAYALVVAACVALTAYATALQRGSVIAATAPLVVVETLVPAVVGIVLLGDRARPGWGWVAAVGFAAAIVGSLGLARHGEVEAPRPDSQETGRSYVT